MKNTTTYQCKSGKKTVKLSCVLFAVISISCTAYFNTFYNAEEAFKAGRDAHALLMRNYPDSLVVTPTPEIVAKYDRAIDKANKTIESFQKKKKWHDDALYMMGRAYFYKKEMEKAIFRFRQLEREFPQSKYIPQSLLFVAKAYIESDNLDKAEEVLLNAEKRFPDLNKDQQISLLMVTIAIRRNGKSQAITLLEQMLTTIKSDKMRLDLYLRTAELYIELKQYEKAILLLKSAPRKKDFPMQLYRIDRALFRSYKAIDSLDIALEKIDGMIGEKNYASYLDEMLYEKGVLLYMLGNYDEAIRVFKKVTAGLDSTNISGDTSSFKAKALVELAKIYQKQKEDYEKAYSYFKLAAASRDSTSRAVAQREVSAIDRLKKLREESVKEDSTHGGRIFSIGELFRFDLDEPDSAYNQFLLLCTDSSTDSAYVPKAMLQAAILARHDLNDSTTGDSLLKAVISRYPASEYAKTAQSELGLKVTISTREDSAKTMYRHAEELFYKENNVKDAIQLFYDLAKTYPELDIAPKSLFAAAWLSSTVLFKKKTAKMLYEKICSSYSESIYCTDIAKPKIKAVIDTLEKLDQLRRNTSHTARQDIRKDAGKSKKSESVSRIPSREPAPVTEQKANEASDSDNLMGPEEKVILDDSASHSADSLSDLRDSAR